MWLTDSKYEEIKAEIAYLLKAYGICHLPIIGFELAAKMGIILRPYSSLSEKKRLRVMELSEDGLYFEPGDGTERIYYNDKKSYERQNWTMLHEIGHCVLGHTADMDADEAEAEANFFAKYIVAPPPLVDCIHPTCAEDIKVVFGLSWEAAEYAFNYYKKWRNLERGYTDYEKVIFYQFQSA